MFAELRDADPDGGGLPRCALRSTGFPRYDDAIERAIRTEWRYRAVMFDGAPAAVCAAIRLAYSKK